MLIKTGINYITENRMCLTYMFVSLCLLIDNSTVQQKIKKNLPAL